MHKRPFKIPVKYTGKMERPKYVALRKMVKNIITQQLKSGKWVSVSPNWFMNVEINGRKIPLNENDINTMWSRIVSDFGLIDDGTGVGNWTMKMHDKTTKMLLEACSELAIK